MHYANGSKTKLFITCYLFFSVSTLPAAISRSKHLHDATNYDLQPVQMDVASLKKLLKLIDRFEHATVIFSPPKNIQVDKGFPLEVSIFPGDKLYRARNLAFKVYNSNQLQVATKFTPKLTGTESNFKITQRSSTTSKTVMSTSQSLDWSWEITPLKSGPARLSLTVETEVRYPHGIGVHEHTFNKKVDINEGAVKALYRDPTIIESMKYLAIALIGYLISKIKKILAFLIFGRIDREAS